MKQEDKTAIAIGIGGAAVIGAGVIWWMTRSKAAPEHRPTEPAAPPQAPPPVTHAPTGWYASAADRDQRIAAATEAAKSGDPAKIQAALAKLSPEDRAKLQSMLPHLPAGGQPQSIPFYGTSAERDKRIAAATAAAQTGDPAKIQAALAKLSPEDRATLKNMFPSL